MSANRIISLVIVIALICMLFTSCECETNEGDDLSSSGISSTIQEETFKLTAANTVVDFQNDTVIICWGDSLTEGMRMAQGYTYPQQLQSDLNGQYRVINAGVPGETSIAISSRANTVKAVLTNDIVFEKGKNSVELDREFLSTADGNVITYKGFGNKLPFNKIAIGGKIFSIMFDKGPSWEEGIYTLISENSDTQLTLKKGTEIRFDYSSQFESVYCNVILMGANDGGISTEELIERYKNLGNSSDKNIYIIPYYTEQDVAAEFKAAFGDNAIDMRDYFVNHAHKDYDLEVTKLDGWCIKKGKTPATFCLDNDKDDCHLSDIGYKIMADQVYNTGVKLGYWK